MLSTTFSSEHSAKPIRSEPLSKNARDILQEFESQIDVKDDFQLHVLKVNVDESGEVEQSGNALPVTKIEIDSDSKECLLHFEEGTSKCVTVSDAKTAFVGAVLDYEVCAAQEKETDDAHIRLDTPLIGFGENVEIKCFFAICQA
jgi:hypothetical protein